MNGVNGDWIREVLEALNTPAGQRRVRELVREVVPILANFIPALKIVQVTLPFIAKILDALNYGVAPVGTTAVPTPSPQLFGADLDTGAAQTAVRQAHGR